ncbi:hypothetical protein [uncultured Sphingomonas sp.]|uniref:hypothetical protein n=1 Tax=uncultured Sphingomonas sp. TaxID=158754 RepID=UPI0025EA6F44|nr:hypothetical protein [uncultured Sphingomonas sp.]
MLVASSAAAGQSTFDRDSVMAEIERVLVLPKGAKPLAAYGRNYALSAQGTVIGTFLLPLPAPAYEGCEVLLADLSSRPCTKAEIADAAAGHAHALSAQAPAGSRRWFDHREALPQIFDGGCSQINVEYDIAKHRILRATCNGVA